MGPADLLDDQIATLVLSPKTRWFDGSTELQLARNFERHWKMVIKMAKSIEHLHVHTQDQTGIWPSCLIL